MNRRTTVLLALIWMGFCFAVGVSASGSHDPISILGNSDFTVENGVVSGSGTTEDPYLIAGWEIDVPADTRYGIKVENTSAHFVIRGVILRDAGDLQGAAIRLGFVSAATIEDTTIANSINGIEMSSCTDVTLRHNVLYVTGQGLRVTGESAEEYRHDINETNLLNDYPINYLYDKDGETVSGLRSNNLYVAASRNMIITENEISDGDGVQLAFVENSQITNNKAYRSRPVLTENGISLSNCTGNSIHGNELANNARAGIYLW
ncbi:MAG TPA: right-handed parallel beta-helix repeat-containing protein, partial [Candidatus Heimdallarchaeota archaeon]|nr:right-handed parallel beta-helix repeat-containing protein [Candidatus Heimdallarchaeota archaeon]